MGEVLTRSRVRALVTVLAIAVFAIAAFAVFKAWRAEAQLASFQNARAETVDIGDDRALILTPENPGTTAALVMHGSQADRNMPRLDYVADFTADLLDAGWVVASADAGGEQWGSTASQKDYIQLAEHLTEDRGIERIVVVSFSMGAISGLGITADHAVPGQVGWVGINPVYDLAAVHADDRYTDLIDAAMSARERGAVDPTALPVEDFSVPMVVYAGDADTTIPAAVHGRALAEDAGADLVTCSGAHLSTDCFRADDVIARFG